MNKQSAITKIFRRIFKVFVYGFIFSIVYLVICKWLMPPITIMQLSSYLSDYGLKRNYVSWNDISLNVKLAAIAGEDQLFATHNGFDWKAIDRSIDNNHKTNDRPAGAAASTISQQTAKNVFLFQGIGILRYLRKPFEAVYTKMIEWIWGKQRILEMYLNVIEMGKGIFGIEAAAQYYFHKPARALSRSEAATIISLLPDPKHLTIHPASAYVAFKSNWILRQMNNLQSDKNIRALITSKK